MFIVFVCFASPQLLERSQPCRLEMSYHILCQIETWNDLYELMHLSTTVLIHATAPVSMTIVDGNNFASRKERRKSKYNMVTPPPPPNINVVFGSDVAWPKSFSRK